MAEGARLESVCTARYRGFESLPHRQIEVLENSKTSLKACNSHELQAFLCLTGSIVSNDILLI